MINVYQRNPFSACKKLSIIKAAIEVGCNFHSASTTTTAARPIASVFPYSEQVLACKISPLLQSCSNPGLDDSSVPFIIRQCQQIHTQITVNGINNFGVLGSRILGIYVLCSNYVDAKNLFYQLKLCYASPWNWVIRGFIVKGWFKFAILFYFKMLDFGTCPDKYTFPYVIKACGGLRALSLGRSVHDLSRDLGLDTDVFVGSALIKFYAGNGCLNDAQLLFDKMPVKDCVLWNTMINGYVNNGNKLVNVIGLFKDMRMSSSKPDSVTYACVLSVCGSGKMIALGTQLHGNIVKSGFETDPPVTNTLIAMYAKCQCLFDAQRLFDLQTGAGLITWNAIIGGYVQNGYMHEGLQTFVKMIAADVKPDSTTLTSLLPVIAESGDLEKGKEIHSYIFRQNVMADVFLKNALIDMYFKGRNVEMACNVFNQSANTVDIVICTSMISGFVLNGRDAKALQMLRWATERNLRPNAVTYASVLPACAGLAALKLGKELHGTILKLGLEGRCYVGSAITDMYAKCGRLDLASLVFSRLTERDAICWNSMIASYCQNAMPKEAIDLFIQMGSKGAKYDCVSISAALSACANLPALHYGKEIHGFMLRGAFSSDIFCESALIDMYAKCGQLKLARLVFDKMGYRNEVSWNSIIAAYGIHGDLNECVFLLNEMKEDGIQPDHVTFLTLISACGHAGRVTEGKQYFDSMTQEFKLVPKMEHYSSMIDLYGRAGCLEEAFQVIKNMPFTPDAGIWGTLLGACRIHGNVELAEIASSSLFHLDPQNSGYYILLSNLQADAGKWEGVHKTRSMMKERGVEKVPGYSWIEVHKNIHMFVAGDTFHPQSAQIYLVLDSLLLELQKEEYVPQLTNSRYHQYIRMPLFCEVS